MISFAKTKSWIAVGAIAIAIAAVSIGVSIRNHNHPEIDKINSSIAWFDDAIANNYVEFGECMGSRDYDLVEVRAITTKDVHTRSMHNYSVISASFKYIYQDSIYVINHNFGTGKYNITVSPADTEMNGIDMNVYLNDHLDLYDAARTIKWDRSIDGPRSNEVSIKSINGRVYYEFGTDLSVVLVDMVTGEIKK